MAKRTIYDGQIAVADADYIHPTEDDEGQLVEAEVEGLDAPVTPRAVLRFRVDHPFAQELGGEARGDGGAGGVNLRHVIDAVRAAYRGMDRDAVAGLAIETIELDEEAGTFEVVVG